MQRRPVRRLMPLAAALALSACAGAAAPPSPKIPVKPGVTHLASEPPCQGEGCRGWSSLLLSGGRDRTQNAVAHEKNLRFAARTLQGRGVRPGRVFFADGAEPSADVQQEEPDAARRRLLIAAGLLLSPEGDLHEAALQYRDHDLPGSQRADLGTVLEGLARDATEAAARPGGDDLLLYVTDHGLHQPDDSNNVIVLWGRRDLSVRDLGTALDAQPSSRRVVAVMAQCFSGSFAALVHQGGDPASALAEHDRCGFFAAPADRPAAGCSPRDDESLYDDYTTRFFAALGGRDRQGQPAPGADADGDGRVSYDEAHFAAITLERTQDVPVSTSEELLRRSRPAWLAESSASDRPYAELLSGARPSLRRAAEELLQASALPADVSVRVLRHRVAALRERCWPGLCEAEEDLAQAQLRAHRALSSAAGLAPLPRQHPALALAAAGPERMARWIDQAQPHFDAVLRLDRIVEGTRVEGETHEARLERLARLGELQALEDRARAEGGPLWASYERVRRCELAGPWPRAR